MEEEEERCMMTSDSSVLLNLFPDWNQHLGSCTSLVTIKDILFNI